MRKRMRSRTTILLAMAMLGLPRIAFAQLFDARATGLTFTPVGPGLYDVGIQWEFGVIGTAPTQEFDIELRVNGNVAAAVRCQLTRLAGSASCEAAGPPCVGPCPPY